MGNMKLLLILMFVGLAVAKKTFFGDQVLTLHPDTQQHVKLIRGLDERIGMVDFWSPQYAHMVKIFSPVDIRIPRAHANSLKMLFRQNGLRFDVKIENVQTLVDEQVRGRKSDSPKALGDYYSTYHSYDDIYSWAVQMADQHDNVEIDFGTSYEGRAIPVLKIQSNPSNPAVLVDCGIHAREWVAPAFCQCFVYNLLEGSDPDLKKFLDTVTFYIIPVVNVDGYAYTWDVDRMWRKTRSPNAGSPCVGTDPNRNFDALWGGPGSSSLPCADTFMGSEMESETEVKQLSDFVKAHNAELKVYVTFHSYSQMILYPYSYTYDLAETTDVLDNYAAQAQQAIKSSHSKNYVYGPGAATIYPAAGGSDDFSYDAGVNLAYTIELRDTGRYGFLLPENQIIPTCEENIEAMKVFAQAAIDLKDEP